jgi:hypothetical protein
MAREYEFYRSVGPAVIGIILGSLRAEGWIGWCETYVLDGQVVSEIRAVREVGTTIPLPGWQTRPTRDLLAEIGVDLPEGLGLSTWSLAVMPGSEPPAPCVWAPEGST